MNNDEQMLTELTREIMALGYSEEVSSRYAVLIGDTPAFDERGNVVVLDNNGAVLAVLGPLKFFNESAG